MADKDSKYYVDKWVAVGLSTERCDRMAATLAVKQLYRDAIAWEDEWKGPRDPHVFFADSPREALLMVRALLSATPIPDDEPRAKASLEEQLGRFPERDYRPGSDDWRDHLWSVRWFGACPAYEAHCDMLTDQGKLSDKRAAASIEVARHCYAVFLQHAFAVVSERPTQLHSILVDGRHIPHRDGGPCSEFADGWRFWALNGVRVPQWLAETPESQLDPKEIIALENAEQRREGIRKVGIERFIQHAGARVLDTATYENDTGSHHYELVEFEFDGVPLRYLKMENPSLPGVYHVEGVTDECDTVRAALNMRNGLTEDMIDDENGVDWYQQGDVILRPEGAHKYKHFPKTLT